MTKERSRLEIMEDIMTTTFIDDADVFELMSLLESDEDIHGELVKAANDVSCCVIHLLRALFGKISKDFLV